MKKILKKHAEYEYQGNCPKCNELQISSFDDEIDILCKSCIGKQRIKKEFDCLIESKIIEIDGDEHGILKIIIETSDNKKHKIYGDGEDMEGITTIDIEKDI